MKGRMTPTWGLIGPPDHHNHPELMWGVLERIPEGTTPGTGEDVGETWIPDIGRSGRGDVPDHSSLKQMKKNCEYCKKKKNKKKNKKKKDQGKKPKITLLDNRLCYLWMPESMETQNHQCYKTLRLVMGKWIHSGKQFSGFHAITFHFQS